MEVLAHTSFVKKNVRLKKMIHVARAGWRYLLKLLLSDLVVLIGTFFLNLFIFFIFCLACFMIRDDSPTTEVEPYIPFNINPAGMQPVLTTNYLLAVPAILARFCQPLLI